MLLKYRFSCETTGRKDRLSYARDGSLAASVFWIARHELPAETPCTKTTTAQFQSTVVIEVMCKTCIQALSWFATLKRKNMATLTGHCRKQTSGALLRTGGEVAYCCNDLSVGLKRWGKISFAVHNSFIVSIWWELLVKELYSKEYEMYPGPCIQIPVQGGLIVSVGSSYTFLVSLSEKERFHPQLYSSLTKELRYIFPLKASSSVLFFPFHIIFSFLLPPWWIILYLTRTMYPVAPNPPRIQTTSNLERNDSNPDPSKAAGTRDLWPFQPPLTQHFVAT